MAQDRETRIPESQPVDYGDEWELDGDGFTVDAQDQDSLFAAVADATTILRHIGGVVQIAPVRRKLGDNIYLTTEYVFRWNSYVAPVKSENGAEPQEAVNA